jgi:hypothetical protein
MMPRVYIASCVRHAELWRAIHTTPDIHFVSRWPFLEPFIDPDPANSRKIWLDDMADVRGCHALIVYAVEGDHLRGALVEAGAALALGRMVIVVGEHPDYGSWQYHPNVTHVATLENALDAVRGRALSPRWASSHE